MRKILYVTNLPAPYKIAFFDLLSKEVDLTVVYERKTAADRDDKWQSDIDRNYKEIYLRGKEVGMESSFSIEILKIIKKNKYDVILMNGYSSPTAILAIAYMHVRKIKYALVCDGILPSEDKFIKKQVKKYLISGADFWMSSGDTTSQQLIKCGADAKKIYWYPFSSVSEADVKTNEYDKLVFKKKIGCSTKNMILYVGQLIHRKGIDVLMEAFKNLNRPDSQLYIVGGGINKITDNIVFVEFKKKEDLTDYYRAADLFVLPTREDIWGLVVNESLATGVPVITTTSCGAGLEILRNGKGGRLVPPDNPEALTKAMCDMLENDELNRQRICAIESARLYTIENMVKYTAEVIDKVCK